MSFIERLNASAVRWSNFYRAIDPSNPVIPGIQLVFRVPFYGAIVMNTVSGDGNPEQLAQNGNAVAGPSRPDVTLTGELEVLVTPELGRKRCEWIKVGLRTELKLDMGPGRMGEQDVLFERSVVISDGNSGVWLDVGSNRFSFTLILPHNLAPADWRKGVLLMHWLYAEVEGIPQLESEVDTAPIPIPAKPKTSFFSALRARSTSPPKSPPSTSPIASPSLMSSSPTGKSPDRPHPLMEAPVESLHALSNSDGKLPEVPPYEVDETWIRGKVKQRRAIYLAYNPNPTGGITHLDERMQGQVKDIGEYELRLSSEVWTVCAWLNTSLSLITLSPKTTIYQIRSTMAETATVISPRDDPLTAKPVITTRIHPIAELGQRPSAEHVHPSKVWSALWRGVGAGGKDNGPWRGELKGRLPSDDDSHPTTFHLMDTPVQLSHQLITEIYFSVYGEDQQGRAMTKPGPGGIRVMKVKKDVVIPSCGFIPRNLILPTYEEGLTPGRIPCPHNRVPRDRLYDGWEKEDEQLTRRMDLCPLCAIGDYPEGPPGWRLCACGRSAEQMEDQSRRLAEDGWDADRGRRRKLEEEQATSNNNQG